MSKSRVLDFIPAALCVAAACWDLVDALTTGAWYLYALAGVLLAIATVNVLLLKPRKEEPAVATDPAQSAAELLGYISSRYGAGGYTFATSANPQPPRKKAPEPFHGLPFDFAVGEVYGMRMWRMDQYGRLGARNWTGLWRPGVNVAKCIKREAPSATMYGYSLGEWIYREKSDHPAPSAGCQCGFYAYTDPFHAETAQFTEKNGEEVVLGIVKGTGRTLIGTMGFRCEKAEIVALRDPTRGGEKTDMWRLKQLANLKRVYPDVPILPSRAALLEFAPLTATLPDPGSNEFWSLP